MPKSRPNQALFSGGTIMGLYRRLQDETPMPGQQLNASDGELMMQQAAQDIDIPLDRLIISRYRLLERRHELQEKVWQLASLDAETDEHHILTERLAMMDKTLVEIDQQIKQLNPFQNLAMQAESSSHNQKLAELLHSFESAFSVKKWIPQHAEKEALSEHIRGFKQIEQLVSKGLSTPFGLSPHQLAQIVNQYDRELKKAERLVQGLHKT